MRVREHGPQASPLADYERLVLDHVRDLSQQTDDGFVPADALTTGPEAMAKGWWRRFERSVVGDARARGLSRSRWSANARTILTTIAIVVGVAIAIASTTLPIDDDDRRRSDRPRAGASARVSAGSLIAVATKLDGERDTRRWSRRRVTLARVAHDARQRPDLRHAATGGGEHLGSHHEPRRGPGRRAERRRRAPLRLGERTAGVEPGRQSLAHRAHPLPASRSAGLRTSSGARRVGAVLWPAAGGLRSRPAPSRSADAILRSFDDLATDRSVPAWRARRHRCTLAVIVTIGALLAAYGVGLLIAGVGDLVRGRRSVEGRVLRIRERGDDNKRFWHVAVDDGTSDRVRAWRMKSAPACGARSHRACPRLAMVAPRERPRGDTNRRPHFGRRCRPHPRLRCPAGAAAAPPLPDASAVSAALGWPVSAATDAVAHPLALDGASRTFVTPDGGRLITAWIRPSELEAHRHMPVSLATPVSGIGEESYRSPMGGGLVARAGGNVLMVVATLPSLDDASVIESSPPSHS